jgi:polysaccharide export outer membrane protein
VGEVHVVDKTVTELTSDLVNLYSKILRDPKIYVVVPEFSTHIKELKKDLHTAPRGLSRLVTVRPDGYVTFPMAGDVFVAGKSVPAVNRELNVLYDAFLPGLHVDLFLEKATGTVVYVLGEVVDPGVYAIDRPLTVMEAISLSNGHKAHAKLNNVIVFRRHEQKLVARGVDVLATLEGGSDTFFMLRPDDIVYVPKTYIGSLAQLMRDISDITFFRGYAISLDTEFSESPLIVH